MLPHAPCQQFYVAHLHHQPWVQVMHSQSFLANSHRGKKGRGLVPKPAWMLFCIIHICLRRETITAIDIAVSWLSSVRWLRVVGMPHSKLSHVKSTTNGTTNGTHLQALQIMIQSWSQSNRLPSTTLPSKLLQYHRALMHCFGKYETHCWIAASHPSPD